MKISDILVLGVFCNTLHRKQRKKAANFCRKRRCFLTPEVLQRLTESKEESYRKSYKESYTRFVEAECQCLLEVSFFIYFFILLLLWLFLEENLLSSTVYEIKLEREHLNLLNQALNLPSDLENACLNMCDRREQSVWLSSKGMSTLTPVMNKILSSHTFFILQQ